MNKSELLTALASFGVTAPDGATNADLQKLLEETRQKAGEAATGGTTGGDQGTAPDPASSTAPPDASTPPPPAPNPPPRPKATAEFRPPEPPRMVHARVIGQPICEEGVHYKKGDVFKLPLERAFALGPGLIEQAEEPDDEDEG